MKGPTSESGVKDEDEQCPRLQVAGLDTNRDRDHGEKFGEETFGVKYEVEYWDREEGGQNPYGF